MRLLLLLAVLASLAPVAVSAKCVSIPYGVTGIVSGPDGAPLIDADVIVTFPEIDEKKVVRTNIYGRYDAHIFYSPGDDEPTREHGALCEERLSKAVVYVSAEGYESSSGGLPIKEAETVTANYSLKRTAADGLR